MSIIELSNVSKSLNGIPLFVNVNLKVEKGEIYGIRGHNGSGKSVLFKIMCGFMKPDSGLVKIDHHYKNEKDDFPKKFGVLIDQPGYKANQTGFDNLKSLAAINDLISDQDIRQAMERVGLNPDIKQKMRNYSLGMKQKVGIVQAFMEGQEVLLLDEPFNALDVASVNQVRDLILGFKKEGKTVVLTSHNQEDLDLLCDQQYLINQESLERIK